MLFFKENSKFNIFSKIAENDKQQINISFNKMRITPDTYVVFDLETTGLSSDSEIIEIGAIKVEKGTITDQFSKLIKPKNPIPANATLVNGITDDMVRNEQTIEEVFPEFIQFLSGYPLIGYNISTYDIPIMQRELYKLGIAYSGDYYDVLDLAREKLPNLRNKKLRTVAAYLCSVGERQHRSLDDCITTNKVYMKLRTENFTDSNDVREQRAKKYNTTLTNATMALQDLQYLMMGIIADNEVSEDEVMTLNQWLEQNVELEGQYPFDRVFNVIKKTLEDGIIDDEEKQSLLTILKDYTDPVGAAQANADSSGCVFCNNTFVLTGDFKHGQRKDIENMIIEAGGLVKSGVSGKTSYVVVGALGSPDWSNGNYGTKIKKAMELKERGNPIRIITEEQLFDALDN